MSKVGGVPENLTPWKPGQTGNKNGRPPKVLSAVIAELKERGYQRVTKDGIVEAFELLMGLDHDQIKEYIEGNHIPIVVRLVGQRLLTKNGFEAIETMLDRAHGKAKQAVEHSGVIESVLTHKTEQELEKMLNEHLTKLAQSGVNPADTNTTGVTEASGTE